MSWIRGQQDAPADRSIASLGRQHTMASLAAAISQLIYDCNPPIAYDMNDTWQVDHTTGERSPTLFELLRPFWIG